MLFAKEPIIQLISLYLAFIYGVIYSEPHPCIPVASLLMHDVLQW